MSQNQQLAIIIPAYKATFLSAALDSIAAQTCQDFTLYIGDDCSPYNLEEIVNLYRDKIKIVYHRFDTNLGGKDLVAQWERCIALSKNEPYIWLFSDDDIMEPYCVEAFFSLNDDVRNNYIVHFNIDVINENDVLLKSPSKFPEILTAKEYLDAKLFQKGIISYVVEFIFPRWVYEKSNGFQNFDLAWGSDFITWLKFADNCKGIFTLTETEYTMIKWRSSNENISPRKSRDIQIKKIMSQIQVAQYIQSFLLKNGYDKSFRYAKFVFGDIKRSILSFKISDIHFLCKNFKVNVGWPLYSAIYFMALLVINIFSKFKSNGF